MQKSKTSIHSRSVFLFWKHGSHSSLAANKKKKRKKELLLKGIFRPPEKKWGGEGKRLTSGRNKKKGGPLEFADSERGKRKLLLSHAFGKRKEKGGAFQSQWRRQWKERGVG